MVFLRASGVEIPLLPDIVIILGLAVFVIFLFKRMKLPTILGFLMTGVIAGPYGLSLVRATDQVSILAEIGVILLLFIIGIEFSLKSLAAIKRSVFIGGGMQVLLTILVVFGLAYSFGYKWEEAVFLGFIFSLSSTAIVLKILQEKGEITTPHGKVILAILIFQDIIVVPMMLFTPLIAGTEGDVVYEIALLLLKAVALIVFVLISARYLVPWILYLVTKTKSKELFILTIVVLCFAIAWLSEWMGLSLALGAFLAGLIISESDYSHQATSNILPFHEIFTSFFFVSIGMLLDLSFMWENLSTVVLLALATFLIKSFIAGLATQILKFPLRTVLLVGFSLFQVGEFAFILSAVGIEYKLLEGSTYQYFLSVSLLTMALTPFVIMAANKYSLRLSNKIQSSRFIAASMNRGYEEDAPEQKLEDHIVIMGFGVNGQNVAAAAKNSGIPYVILELNPETVKKYKEKGEPIYYGDAVETEVLRHLNVQKARVIVVAVSDAQATKCIIVSLKQCTQTAHIIARTRFLAEMNELHQLGADEVIPEEFETSIEIFVRVLNKYLVPRSQIKEFVKAVRSDNYEMLRGSGPSANLLVSDFIPDLVFNSFEVEQGPNEVVGRTVGESELRKRFGVTLVAIKREDKVLPNIHADTFIKQDDILYVFGQPADMDKFYELIKV